MQFLSLTLSTPAENLALDEALLLEADADRGSEILRLWEWSQSAVILGAGCSIAEDVDEAACVFHQVPIWRRPSGGGTVLLGAGCLCFSLVLAYERAPALRDIRPSYIYILEQVRVALTDILPNIELAGTSDLAVGGLKFSGNSQQRKRRYLLHHGTLLYKFDLSRVGRYLHMPARQPDYRQHRDHSAFLMNLPTDAQTLESRLRTAWGATTETHTWPRDLVQQLVVDKYMKPEWIRRR
jgi:lipoate-protein ligase A